jgi:hypothetical protein
MAAGTAWPLEWLSSANGIPEYLGIADDIPITLTNRSWYTLAGHMEIDLHGYHPRDIVWNRVLAKVVEQAWEMGERELILIHGHGRLVKSTALKTQK